MEQIEGLFGILVEAHGAAYVEGPFIYEQAIENYHLLVKTFAETETEFRLIKLSFLD